MKSFLYILFVLGCTNSSIKKVEYNGDVLLNEDLKNAFINGNELINYFNYDGVEFGNRFVFYENGNLKEYDFIRNKTHATYMVLFDSLNNSITKVVGDPLCYTYYGVNESKDSAVIKGIISTIISNDIKITITDINTNEKYIVNKMNALSSSNLLKTFQYVFPINTDSVKTLIELKVLSQIFIDSIYLQESTIEIIR